MANNKQLAVEWLMVQLYERGLINKPDGTTVNGNDLDDLLEQATEIEKENIISAFKTIVISYTAEEYYNGIYGK